MKFTALAYLASMATMATATPLDKRADYSGRVWPLGLPNGQLTTCGQVYVEGSRWVAVASDLLGLPANCARTITITCGDRTTTGQVVDRCMGCQHDMINVSDAVYESLGGSDGWDLACTWSF